MIDTHELAWAAGFFDGEGSTSWKGGNPHTTAPRRYLRMTVGQKDPRALRRFHAAVLGIGAFYSPNRKAGEFHYWSTTSTSHVHMVMNILWPYLGEAKREQFERVSEDISRFNAALPTKRKSP